MSQVKFVDGKRRRRLASSWWIIFNVLIRSLSGEKVLCYHGNLIYEAKVLKTKTEKNNLKFLIHYAGWSKNWDEWVGETRVLKFNATNVELQKDIQKKMDNSAKGTKKAPKSGPKKS